MKVLVLLVTIAISFMFSTNSRQLQTDKCNLFGRTTKLIDTLILDVTYLGLVRLPDHIALRYLEKRNLLLVKNFNSSLMFQPVNCPFEYNLVYSDPSKEGRSTVGPQNIGKKVQITCVIYNDRTIPGYENEPFVAIIKVRKIE